MSKKYGILLVSHVKELAEGVSDLLSEMAGDVTITVAGGTDDNGIGTSFNKIFEAAITNGADEILAFYDLGSSKMNLEIVIESTDKKIHLFDTAFIEGSFTAATLIQANTPFDAMLEQLDPLKIK